MENNTTTKLIKLNKMKQETLEEVAERLNPYVLNGSEEDMRKEKKIKTGKPRKYKTTVETTTIHKLIPAKKKREIENKVEDLINEICKDELFVR